MLREFKSDLQSLTEVWSALQLHVEHKKGMGARCGCYTAVHLHRFPHEEGGFEFHVLIPRIWNDARQKIKWVFSCCFSAYYLVVFPKENDFTAISRYLIMDFWRRGDCLACLLQTPRTLGFNRRARWTAKQLCKHRLVPSLVCLITDVSVLTNVVIIWYDLRALGTA